MEEEKTRVCRDCGEEKDLDDFGKKKDGKNGRTNFCKKCISKRRKSYNDNYRLINREKINERSRIYQNERKEYRKKYYLDNKTKCNEKSRLFRKNNRELCNEFYRKYREKTSGKVQKEYRLRNKEKVNLLSLQWYHLHREQIREYRKKNRASINESFKKWCKENPEKVKEYQKKYYWTKGKNSLKRKAKYTKYNRKIVDELKEIYVKKLIDANFKGFTKFVFASKEVIQLKRNTVALKRAMEKTNHKKIRSNSYEER